LGLYPSALLIYLIVSPNEFLVLPLIQINCHRFSEPRQIIGNIMPKSATINLDRREYIICLIFTHVQNEFAYVNM
jgi:hypothetical protein